MPEETTHREGRAEETRVVRLHVRVERQRQYGEAQATHLNAHPARHSFDLKDGSIGPVDLDLHRTFEIVSRSPNVCFGGRRYFETRLDDKRPHPVWP